MDMDRKVYELELRGKKRTRIEGLDKVSSVFAIFLVAHVIQTILTYSPHGHLQYTSLRVLDMSCNELDKIEGLSKNHVCKLCCMRH